MSRILARGAAMLHYKMETAASETVRVLRGAEVLCDEWLATPAKNQLEAILEGAVTIDASRLDWSGATASWRSAGSPTKPQRGDAIEWTRTGEVWAFEVLPADGEDVWSPAGPFGDRMRVHTKLIERRSTE